MISRRHQIYILFSYLRKRGVLDEYIEEKRRYEHCHPWQVTRIMLERLTKDRCTSKDPLILLKMFRSPSVSFTYAYTKKERMWFDLADEIEKEFPF